MNSKNNEKNQSVAKTISNVVIVLKYLLVKLMFPDYEKITF